MGRGKKKKSSSFLDGKSMNRGQNSICGLVAWGNKNAEMVNEARIKAKTV